MIFEKLANWKWQQREVIEIKFYINRTYLNNPFWNKGRYNSVSVNNIFAILYTLCLLLSQYPLDSMYSTNIFL